MKPEYTLHKLPEGFILTSNEGIEIGNQVYPKTENIYGGNQISTCLSFGKGCWSEHIITELTGEEGYHPAHLLKVVAQQGQIDFSNLSEKEQKEIEWFDLEKLYPTGDKGAMSMPSTREINNSLRQEGFKKAQELLSDKMFTLDDISKIFIGEDENGGLFDDFLDYRITTNEEITFKEWYLKQCPFHHKSWKVEIEIESVHTDRVEGGFEYFPKFTNGKIKILRLL